MTLDRLTSVTVGLPVEDLAAARAWYAELLGREPDLEPAPGVVEFRLTPGCWLQLLERPGLGRRGHGRPGHEGPAGAAQDDRPVPVLRFGVPDIDAVCSRLQERRVDTGPVHTVPGAVRYCEFLDPFRNRLSLYQVLEQETS